MQAGAVQLFRGRPARNRRTTPASRPSPPGTTRLAQPAWPGGGRAQGTLTNLYNARPAWLAAAHARFDAAVFAAYGWPDDLSDEELLVRLLVLNVA